MGVVMNKHLHDIGAREIIESAIKAIATTDTGRGVAPLARHLGVARTTLLRWRERPELLPYWAAMEMRAVAADR